MRKAVAIFGLCLLVSQVALGGASALFLCLCQGDSAHPEPCEPTAASDSCHESTNETSAPAEVAAEVECSPCPDLLITLSEKLAIDRLNELLTVKAPMAIASIAFERPRFALHPLPASPRLLAHPRFAIPRSSEAYTRTIKLLR